MQVGKKVVCVNGVFSDTIKQLYRELPAEGVTYTVRATTLGRDKVIHVEGGKYIPNAASDSVTVRILLHELHNGPDPFHTRNEELGFNAERFREIDSVEVEEPLAAELVEVN